MFELIRYENFDLHIRYSIVNLIIANEIMIFFLSYEWEWSINEYCHTRYNPASCILNVLSTFPLCIKKQIDKAFLTSIDLFACDAERMHY